MKLFFPITLYILSSTAGLLLLRVSLRTITHFNIATLRGMLANPVFVGGAMLYILSFVTWLYLLSQREVTTIYPIVLGLGYTAVVVASFLFLQERVSGIQVVGIILVGLGLLLIAR